MLLLILALIGFHAWLLGCGGKRWRSNPGLIPRWRGRLGTTERHGAWSPNRERSSWIRGYGYADLATHRRNDANTEYGLANATTTALMVADVLQGTQSITGISPNNVAGTMTDLSWGLCTEFSQPDYANVLCPQAWSRLTVANLVDGTAGLSNYRTGAKGQDVTTSWHTVPGAPRPAPDPGPGGIFHL